MGDQPAGERPESTCPERAALALQERLGHGFAEPALLEQALTHQSTVARGAKRSNERLEFLGDRVLGLIVAHLLIETFPKEPEGALGRRFAVLVSGETLAQVAETLSLGDALLVSTSERPHPEAPLNPGILADACEAVIGALYLDGGLEAARRFVEATWRPLIALDRRPPQAAKTALQEWALARALPLPTYRLVSQEGPPHDPRFVIEVSVEGRAGEQGEGRSKRQAQQAAAEKLLGRLTEART